MKTYRILIIFCLYTLFSVKAFAVLPDISKAIETRLHQGTSEEITSFIEKQLALVAQLADEAETLREQTINPPDQEALANTVNVFRGISAQSQRLQSELKRTADLTLKAPQLGAAPYTPADFRSIRSFQQEVEQQLVGDTGDIELLGKKLSTVKKNLESLLFDYSRMRRVDSERAFAFEKAADLFSFQSEYSLLTLRLSRLQKQVDHLHVLQEEGVVLIKACLKALHVSEEEWSAAKKSFEEVSLQEEAFLQEAQKESNSINNQLLRFELQLENVAGKLEKEKEDNSRKQLLKIEKRRIDSIIDTLNIKQQGLEQKILNLKINAIRASSLNNWLSRYGGYEEQKSMREVIQSWRGQRDDLSTTAKSVQEELSQANTSKSQLTQKLLLVADARRASPGQQIKDALSALERQLLKESELTDELIATISKNNNLIRALSDEISWALDQMLTEIPWHENLQVYFEKYVHKSWEKSKSVLYYPLLSVGGTSITLSAIVKLILLLIVGLILLRVARRKVATLLEAKTRLTFGSVTSITTLGYYVALVLGAFAILTTMGVNLSQITVIVGALGVGIGFGLQTIANNFISGIVLLSEQTIKAGDIVNLESGITGVVNNVAIRSTIIRTVNGDDVIVPNAEFVSGRVNTWTYGDDWRRLTIPFGVSYGSDPDVIVRLAEEAAREVEITREDADHPLRIIFEGFGNNSLDFSIRVWCRMYQLPVISGLRSDYYFILFRKFKEAGITIPFPQRDLHLQSISPQASGSLKKIVTKGAEED